MLRSLKMLKRCYIDSGLPFLKYVLHMLKNVFKKKNYYCIRFEDRYAQVKSDFAQRNVVLSKKKDCIKHMRTPCLPTLLCFVSSTSYLFGQLLKQGAGSGRGS